MKRILIATDGSASANRAQWFAAALARDTGCTLVVVAVMENEPDAELETFGQIEGISVTESVEQWAADILSSARADLTTAGVAAIETELADGDPAISILSLAEQKDIDLIVVGKRGRGRLAGLLLGSVSQKLVSLAQCAVAIVP